MLPRATTTAIVASLLAVAAVAWLITSRQAASMSMMVTGLAQVGRRMPNHMDLPAFLGMWAAMMAAMMSPAAAPVVLAHRLVLGRRGENAASSVAFIVGFLAVWSLVGVLYFVPFLLFQSPPASAVTSRWLPVLAGAILMLAGGYQFTQHKTQCQQACCTPLSLVLHQDAGRGIASALRTGASHGIHCLGCCWALMTVLLVVGLMNLVWMVALSLLFIVEKHWRRGLRLGRVVGIALVLLGLAVMVQPSLLHTIAGTSSEVQSTTSMDMR